MQIKFDLRGFSIGLKSYRIEAVGTRVLDPGEVEEVVKLLAQNYKPEIPKPILSVSCPRCGTLLPNVNAVHTLGDNLTLCGPLTAVKTHPDALIACGAWLDISTTRCGICVRCLNEDGLVGVIRNWF